MATFLQLVNDVERESGTIHQLQRLATVASPVGRQEKIVQHVVEAWRQIQNSRTDWQWLITAFNGTLVPTQSVYAPAALSAANFANWTRPDPRYSPFSLYDAAIGRADEAPISRIDYRHWLTKWDRGVPALQRPTEYAIDGQRNLCLGGPPDKNYKIRGTYYRSAQVLTADTDVPLCPPEYHRVIVWKALILLGGYDEASFAVAHAQSNFISTYRDLVNGTTEQVSL